MKPQVMNLVFELAANALGLDFAGPGSSGSVERLRKRSGG